MLVSSITYKNNMTPADTLQAASIRESGQFGFPYTQRLNQTVIANDIWISSFRFSASPYLELRGCDLEGKTVQAKLSIKIGNQCCQLKLSMNSVNQNCQTKLAIKTVIKTFVVSKTNLGFGII